MARPSVAMISFSTRPGHGSEGGVGWSFVEAAQEASTKAGLDLQVIIDARDAAQVKPRLVAAGMAESAVHACELGRMARRAGDARTRWSYLDWRRSAARLLEEIGAGHRIDVVHQVTFASSVLPPVTSLGSGVRFVWGPVGVPAGAGVGLEKRLASSVAARVARLNARNADLLVATNEIAYAALGGTGAQLALEPNIVVHERLLDFGEVQRDRHLISTVGLLIPLKRPWVSIEALANPQLEGYRLQMIGDGPLLPRLRRLAQHLGVSDRVSFLGRVSREEVIRLIASSAVLAHPSSREGAAWVVGEAAAVGTPAVVFEGSGAETAVRLSDNGGRICQPTGNLASLMASAIVDISADFVPTRRWASARLPDLLLRWWGFA